ncbi:hypothetical protein QR98_0086570, partial [Sarcoptes scabiei]
MILAQYGGGGGGSGYGMEAYGTQPDAPRQVKLNLGLHVPPIIFKMPRMTMPQMTIRANFIRQPYAKPLEINMPPAPQIQFGDDYGSGASNHGNYGGSAQSDSPAHRGYGPAPMPMMAPASTGYGG